MSENYPDWESLCKAAMRERAYAWECNAELEARITKLREALEHSVKSHHIDCETKNYPCSCGADAAWEALSQDDKESAGE